MTLSKLVRKAVLSTLIGATTVTGIGMAQNAAADDLAEAKTIVVTPFKGGAGSNGSQWYGPVRLSNTSHNETADGIVYVLPQQNNNIETAPRFEYHIPPRQSMIIDNLWQYFTDQNNEQPDYGNVSLRVEPTDSIDISVAAFIKNVQNLNEDNEYVIDPHNTNVTTTDLLQGLQGIGDNQFLLPGDYVTIMAPSVQLQEYGDPVQTKEMNRLNVFFYGRQDAFGNDPEVYCELYHADGTPNSERWFDLNTNGGSQITNFIKNNAGMGRTPTGNENIKCTVTKGEALIMPSVAKNNVDLPGVDDGYSMIPEVTRLVEEATYTTSPNVTEANDPAIFSVNIKTRPGTTIESVRIYGGIIAHLGGSDNNEFTHHRTEYPTMPGTYENYAGFTVRSEYGDFTRTTTPHLHDIMAEQDYEFAADDVNDIIMANKTEIALILSRGVYTGDQVQYPPSVWEDVLDMYQDGVNTTDNMEAATYRVADSQNPGKFTVIGIDSRAESVKWHYEADLDRLKEILSGN